MSEKYIRVEDLRNCSITRTVKEHGYSYDKLINLSDIPTYTPADILAGMWVPVTERLPEPYDTVIVFTLFEGKCGVTRTGFVNKNGAWFHHDNTLADIPITHWMPLPQPPKEAT